MKTLEVKKFARFLYAVIAVLLLVACSSESPSPTPESTIAPTSIPEPTIEPAVAPTPTPEPTSSHENESNMDATEPTSKIDPLVFQQAVRRLWEDHIVWTRVYIIAATADLPEADTAAERLLQNQVDIGDAIKGFYGDEAGEQLTALLNDHILTAVEILAAAKSGDTAALEDANARWYENGNQIAAFLTVANPASWPLPEMESMMQSHLDLTLAEATARLNEDWAGDVAAYDNIHNQILEMADMISGGIIEQFPDAFEAQQASRKEVELTLAMNKLWEDHIVWTRVYIIAATADLPEADTAAERLLQNQVDIGDAIKGFYGDEAGEQLTALLNDHILTAVEILAAAKSGDTVVLEDANARWYENGNQIAAFLNAANPASWPLPEMESMMQSHLDLTLAEATARLNEDWAGDVAAYDNIHNQILEMAGMLTQGILAQFPLTD